jgi:hypothetical protein
MKLKLFVLVSILLMIFTGLFSFAQDCGYYPVRKGAVMGYKSLDEKGKLLNTSLTTILDVKQSASSSEYKVKAEFWDEKNKPQQTREYSMKCENGVFSVDMQSLIDPKAFEGFKDMELTFSGIDLTFPSALSIGQSLPDANMLMAASSGGITIMRLTINITNRKVVGVESITVPAGTFECYKMTYDLETKLGFKVVSSAVQWLNKGAGSVKTETYDKKGKLVGSTILNEFTP